MRAAAKMLMLSRGGENRNGGYNRNEQARNESSRGNRGEIGGMEMGYGRSEIDYGGMEMRSGNMGYEGAENARRYRRYSDGRFRPRSEMDMGGDEEEEMEMHYPGGYPFPPPIYQRNENRENQNRNAYRAREEGSRMNQIGFDYRGDATYQPRNEMERYGGSMEMGGAHGEHLKLDRETAEEWMAGLENRDETKGPHWTMEQTKHFMAKRGFEYDPVEWWVAMNAMYSDFVKAAKKHNVNNIDFYTDIAKAWLDDPDAVDEKAAAYYKYVVK